MAKKIVKEVDIKVDSSDVKKASQDLKDLGEQGKNATSDIAGGFSSLPGPIGGFGNALNGAKAAITSANLAVRGLMASLGVLFLPVTIAVAAFVLTFKGLQQYFNSTEKRANKLAVVMAQLGSVVGNIAEAFNNIVEGNYAAAWKNLTSEIVKDVNAAGKLTKELQRIEIESRKLNETRSETNKLIEDQRAIAKDLSKTEEERSAALQKAIKLEEEQTEKELANATARYEAEIALSELNDTDKKTTEELSVLKAGLSDIEAAGLARIRTLKSEQNGLDIKISKEEQKRQKDLVDSALKNAEERKKIAEDTAERELAIIKELENTRLAIMSEGIAKDEAEVELAFQRRLAKLQEDGLLTNELDDLIEEEKQIKLKEIRDRYKEEADAKALEDAEKKKALLDKEVADAKVAEEEKKAARAATIDAALSGAQGFAQAVQSLSNAIFQNELNNAKGNAEEEEKIRKKAFKANKALGIVNAVISTAQAVISGFNAGASMGPAGVVMGPVMAALAGVTGAIQIAAIASAKYTPTGGSSGSRPQTPAAPSLPSAGAPQQPNVTFTGSGNNLNTAGGGANTQPTPVVINTNVSVSETEMTNTQQTVSQYESAASLGG